MKKSIKLLLLTACVFTVASCGPGDDGSVKDISNLAYDFDSKVISWSSVTGANGYFVSINNGERTTQVTATASGVSMNFDSHNEDFDFQVEALIKGQGDSSNPTYSMRFIHIPTVNDITIANGTATWEYLAEADGYDVKLNGTVTHTTKNCVELKTGAFTIAVKPTHTTSDTHNNNPYYSSFGSMVQGEILPTPTQVGYDGEKFTWQAVTGADSYNIKIDNDEPIVSKTNSYAYTGKKDAFKVSVQAISSNPRRHPSVYSEPITYSYIEPINNFDVIDGVLKWNAPEHVASYKIKIDGIEQPSVLTKPEYVLPSGQSHIYQIKPVASTNFYYSEWGAEKAVTIVSAPTVTYRNNVLEWNNISNADGYTVKIVKNGEELAPIAVPAGAHTYAYPFTDAGEYQVSVQSNVTDTSSGYYSSKFGSPLPVTRLSAPENVTVTNNPKEAKQINVSCTKVAKAAYYELLCNGVPVISNSTSNTFNVDVSQLSLETAAATLTLGVKCYGSVSASAAVLESLTAKEVQVVKLATPQNIVLDGTRLTWDNVQNATKYVVTIDGKKDIVTSNAYTLGELVPGDHTIYVQAMGDGANQICSNLSNAVIISKLATPVLKTTVSEDNMFVQWQTIHGANGYVVKLGTTLYNVQAAYFGATEQLSLYTPGSGTEISVYAKGNGIDILDSNPCKTQTIYRFDKPTNLGIEGDNIVWKCAKVDNKSPNKYKIDIDGDVTVIQNNSYPLANLECGEHTVRVSALGNYDDFVLPSEESDTFTFTKLEAPTNIVKEGKRISWDSVANAIQYKITGINSTPIFTNNTYIDLSFKEAGNKHICIYALGDGFTYVDSKPCEMDQLIRALPTPEKEPDLDWSFTCELKEGRLYITMAECEEADAYQFVIAGQTITQEVDKVGDANILVQTLSAPVTYDITVRYIAHHFDNEGNYVIDSNISSTVTIDNRK